MQLTLASLPEARHIDISSFQGGGRHELANRTELTDAQGTAAVTAQWGKHGLIAEHE